MMSRTHLFNNGHIAPKGGLIQQPYMRMSSGIGYHPIFGYGIYGGDTGNKDSLLVNIDDRLEDMDEDRDAFIDRAYAENLAALSELGNKGIQDNKHYFDEMMVLANMRQKGHSRSDVYEKVPFMDTPDTEYQYKQLVDADFLKQIEDLQAERSANEHLVADTSEQTLDTSTDLFKQLLSDIESFDPENKAHIDNTIKHINKLLNSDNLLDNFRGEYLLIQFDVLKSQYENYTHLKPSEFPGFEQQITQINSNFGRKNNYTEEKDKQLIYIIKKIYSLTDEEPSSTNIFMMDTLVNSYNNLVHRDKRIGIQNGAIIHNPELPSISDFTGESNPKNPTEIAGGKAFEAYFNSNLKRFCKMIGVTSKGFIENSKNPNLYTPGSRSGYTFDFSTDDAELELKNYNTGQHNVTIESILEDGGISIQDNKLGSPFMMPLYQAEGDDYKLYNVLSTKPDNARQWVNDTTGKAVIVVFKTADGYYTYDLTKDQDYDWTDVKTYIEDRSKKNSKNPWKSDEEDLKNALTSLTNEQKNNLYIPVRPDSYKKTQVYGNKTGFFIPLDKLVKQYLKPK